jgi:hypothetical protein
LGRTPDRQVGPSQEEEQQWEDRGPGGDNDGDPSIEGAMRRVTNVVRYFVDGVATQLARWKNVPAGFDDVDLNGITNGQGLSYNSTSKQMEPATFAGGSDELAKVSANDTTAGYLNGKLVAGDGVAFVEVDDAGDETLEVHTTRKWRRHFMLMGG